MCVAVATDAGLITPIVFGADRKVGYFLFFLMKLYVLLRINTYLYTYCGIRI